MKIGRIIEEDLPLLAELHKQFWGKESSVEKMRVTFRKLNENPNYIFVSIKERGCLIGSAMGILCEELCGTGKTVIRLRKASRLPKNLSGE